MSLSPISDLGERLRAAATPRHPAEPPTLAQEASWADPSRMVEVLAEMVGQLQHVVQLLEAAFGRNPYTPLVYDLSAGTTQTLNLPPEACQIEQIQVAGDTAVTVKVYLLSQYTRGLAAGLGLLIGQMYMPVGAPVPALQLNCPVPAGGDNQLTIKTSAAVANGAATVTLAPTRPGSNSTHAG